MIERRLERQCYWEGEKCRSRRFITVCVPLEERVIASVADIIVDHNIVLFAQRTHQIEPRILAPISPARQHIAVADQQQRSKNEQRSYAHGYISSSARRVIS